MAGLPLGKRRRLHAIVDIPGRAQVSRGSPRRIVHLATPRLEPSPSTVGASEPPAQGGIASATNLGTYLHHMATVFRVDPRHVGIGRGGFRRDAGESRQRRGHVDRAEIVDMQADEIVEQLQCLSESDLADRQARQIDQESFDAGPLAFAAEEHRGPIAVAGPQTTLERKSVHFAGLEPLHRPFGAGNIGGVDPRSPRQRGGVAGPTEHATRAFRKHAHAVGTNLEESIDPSRDQFGQGRRVEYAIGVSEGFERIHPIDFR